MKLSKICPSLRERAAGIVFASQMCGVVAVDREGTPIRPCMIWLDKRAAGIAREVMGGFPTLYGYGLLKLRPFLAHDALDMDVLLYSEMRDAGCFDEDAEELHGPAGF